MRTRRDFIKKTTAGLAAFTIIPGHVMGKSFDFSREEWPLAFELMSNAGGKEHEGYIGIQYHGGEAWFRNIVIRKID